MPELVDLTGTDTLPAAAGPDLLRPSEYTALLLQALDLRADRIRNASVLEIGVGSGVVLAALAGLGAASLAGVDIEALAVRRAGALLAALPAAPPHAVVCGNLWAPFPGQHFDVIVANLPHFPARTVTSTTRLSSWSNSGVDGRKLIDPFLHGLQAHMAAGGIALVVHSEFLDLDATRACLAAYDLEVQPVVTALIQVEAAKLLAMTAAVRARCEGTAIRQYGPYVFSRTHVLEIRRRPAPQRDAAA